MTSTIDDIFSIIGKFGTYQKLHSFLFCIAITFIGAISCTYVFTALKLEYRCNIPGCEHANNTILEIYLPTDKHNIFEGCSKYKHDIVFDDCAIQEVINSVDNSTTVSCDDFVYSGERSSILKDFHLECDKNYWMLPLVGTINNVGQLLGLPTSGFISDRYGRKICFVLGMTGSALFGILRSFSTYYLMFLSFEFCDAFFASATYASIFVLAVELVQPDKRVLIGTVICCCFAIGEIFTGLIAMVVISWRSILKIIYFPCLLFITYYWLSPESIRWLLTQGRITEAKARILTIAAKNQTEISSAILNKLTKEDKPHNDPVTNILKSPKLLLRFIICCYCWITCTFVFYGLTLNSVTLSNNLYSDFMLTCLVEIPAYFAVYFILDSLGRRPTIFISYAITAVTCLLFVFISEDYHSLSTSLYLIGKFGATGAFAIIYAITSEIFPTNLRHSLMGACSMFGRIGAIVAPQVPLLGQYYSGLPILLFSGMSAIAALVSLKFPETANTYLPNSIEEAENIGMKGFSYGDEELQAHNKRNP